MSHRILVVYYSQTGQLREIMDSVLQPVQASGQVEVVYEELKPRVPFPFPWTSDEFFQAMPESVKGIPCELEPLSVKGNEQFDLVILAWQPWYLSPSIPLHAFMQTDTAKQLLHGKPVLSLIGSRNMWIMAYEDLQKYIRECGAYMAGNIVLYDKAPNLLSVVSIIRWMFKGKKDRYMKVIPPAGVSPEDIRNASSYGKIILESLGDQSMDKLRPRLVEAGAVDVLPEILMIEKRGKMFFRIWSSFILKKGDYGDPARLPRIRLFKYYLLTVLYLVSPFASLLFFILKPFRRGALKKQISLYQSM
jgi:hypothetical protein